MRSLGARSILAVACAVLFLASEALVLGAPGFGLRKKVIQLQMRKPAAVRLANTSIGFRGKSTNPEYQSVYNSLEATLETELLSNEHSLVKKSPEQADWVLELTVTGFSNPAPTKKTQQVQSNNTAIETVRWNGSLNVAYQVLDKKGGVHDADNVHFNYDREFTQNASTGGNRSWSLPSVPPIPGITKAAPKSNEPEPHSNEDLKQILVRQIVSQIGSSLGNTVQPAEAQVAGGDDHLDRAATFMSQRLWARAIEELEKTPPYAKPEDESYRQYDLGLAYEAMSYNAETYTDQKNNLFKALECYDKAGDQNPSQKYFVEVIARTKDSVARYRRLDSMKKDDLVAKAAVGGGPAVPDGVTKTSRPEAAPAAGPAPVPDPAKNAQRSLTAKKVCDLFEAGVAQAQIIEVIRESAADYDLLDTDTLVLMAQKKVPQIIVNEMRKKKGMAALADSSAPKKVTTPAPAPKPASPAIPVVKPAASTTATGTSVR